MQQKSRTCMEKTSLSYYIHDYLDIDCTKQQPTHTLASYSLQPWIGKLLHYRDVDKHNTYTTFSCAMSCLWVNSIQLESEKTFDSYWSRQWQTSKSYSEEETLQIVLKIHSYRKAGGNCRRRSPLEMKMLHKIKVFRSILTSRSVILLEDRINEDVFLLGFCAELSSLGSLSKSAYCHPFCQLCSTQTQSHAVVIDATCSLASSCWNEQGLPWKQTLYGWERMFYLKPASILLR